MKGNILEYAKKLVAAIREAENPQGLFLVSVVSLESGMDEVQYAEEDLQYKTIERTKGKVYAEASRLLLLAKARYPGVWAINCTVNDEVPTSVFRDKRVLRINDLDA